MKKVYDTGKERLECTQLRGAPYFYEACPRCGEPFPEFMRGQVQRGKRFLWVLWRRPYCAVICHKCKRIVGWESPQLSTSQGDG